MGRDTRSETLQRPSDRTTKTQPPPPEEEGAQKKKSKGVSGDLTQEPLGMLGEIQGIAMTTTKASWSLLS